MPPRLRLPRMPIRFAPRLRPRGPSWRRRADRNEASTLKLPRRRFLYLATAATALPSLARMAAAQAYPTRPVRLIIGYPPGGSADITARLIGQWLSERLGQPVVIESRPGAGTNIATETVVNAPPDGYTLLLVAPANAINATLYEKLNHNFMRDIAPVAGLIRFPNVIVVNPSVPAKTVPELIAYAKANLGKLNMASSGADRPDQRPSSSDVRQRADVHRVHQSGEAAALGGDHHGALQCAAGSAARRRLRAGLRGERVVWRRGAEGNTRSDHRQAQQGDQRDPRGSQGEGTLRRARRLAHCGLARRIRAARRG